MKKIEMFLSTVFANNSANSNKCNKINFWCRLGCPPSFVIFKANEFETH